MLSDDPCGPEWAGYTFNYNIQSLIHMPLHACIIIVGAAMAKIVSEFAKDENYNIKEGQRYAFAFGSGLVILAFTIISVMNVTHEVDCRVGKYRRLVIRVFVSIGLFLLAVFGEDLGPLGLLGTVVGVLIPMVIFEEYALLKTLKSVSHSEERLD
jgi:hypothetical protein